VRTSSRLLLLMGVLTLLSTPAALAESPLPGEVDDPWEPMNRRVHAFNERADQWVMRPVAVGYARVVPRPVRRGVTNFFGNLLYPVTIVNQLLQGKVKDGVVDAGRFVVNTTLGVAGIFDPATRIGFPRNEEDFGQTFAVWGLGRGNYIVVPFLGPSTIADGIGVGITAFFFFPVSEIPDATLRNSVYGVYFTNLRAELLDADSLISGDRYEFMRDVYLQRREYLIADGEVEDPFLDDDWDDWDDDDDWNDE
jgi:phospholipid-binding lipoprotein MlaA